MKKNIFDKCFSRLAMNNLQKKSADGNHGAPMRKGVHHMLCHKSIIRHVTCMAIMLTISLCAAIPRACSQTENSQYGVTVAIIPFEVFSIGKEPTLGNEATELLSQHLALNPSIVCVDTRQISTIMQTGEYGSMTGARLRQLAKLLNADYIIMGTITKIRDEHSIDIEMHNTTSAGSNFKTFSEGLEIESLVETIATVLDQEIMENAIRIPPAKRPRINTARQLSSQTSTNGFDVDRELLAAFGPMKQSPAQNTGVPPSTAKEAIPAASTLTEETIFDESQTLRQPDSQPRAGSDNMPAIDQREERIATGASQEKKASGFFSLSKAISINSDTMEYDNRANKGIFKGNVVARQADIVMFANAMHVHYSEGGGVSRVEAKGNVRVVQGDRVATGSSIVFNNATQTIVATGNPRIWQGDNVVHGTRITVYLKEERTVVESDPGDRASATIYPGSDEKKP